MISPIRFATLYAALCVPLAASADTLTKPAEHSPDADLAAARAIVAAVNAVVAADVGIPPAGFASCPLDGLPAARAKLLPLLPPEHRRLIAECARGRTRMQRDLRGLDLLALLDDPVEASSEAAAIRAFFDERTVDVALGSAVSEGPYPISFDWAVVLDADTHTLYSFIVNCTD